MSERKIRVALFADEGANAECVEETAAACGPGADVTRVMGADVRGGALEDKDLFISPGGGASTQSKALGEEGNELLRAFVRAGGGYIGICAGAYWAAQNNPYPLAITAARMPSPKWDRGRAELKVELTPEGQTFFGESETHFIMHYANGPVLFPDAACGLPPFEVLAYFRAEIAENGTPPGLQIDTPAIVRAQYGRGRVVLFSPHPEESGLERWVRRAMEYAAAPSE